METPTLRTGKAKDLSVRTGSKSVQKLEKNAQNITGTVADLQRRLQELETGKVLLTWCLCNYLLSSCTICLTVAYGVPDIAADQLGKQDFETHLAELNRKKEDLQKRVDGNKRWTVCIPCYFDCGPYIDPGCSSSTC